MTVRVRVRGIAATALTKILMDTGYVIVQASKVIQERMGIPLNTSPADVTVKDADPDELLVIGFPDKARKVLDTLVDVLKGVFVWKPKLNLHSTVVAKVVKRENNRCILELPYGLKTVLDNCRFQEGSLETVSIVKAPVKPGEPLRVSTNIRVIGEYVALIYGSTRLTVSEHIRDESKRKELLAVATASVIGKGYGVHLRSSSAHASPHDITNEIRVLEDKLKKIINDAKQCSEPCVVYEGEFIALLGLTSVAKRILDEERNKVIPTVAGHHSYKTCSNTLSDIVDYSELLLKNNVERRVVEECLREYIISKNTGLPRVSIIHVKPDGKVHELTPGKVEAISSIDGRVKIRLKRVFRSHGVYDGIGVEKKPGDYDEMVVEEGKWYIIHNYKRVDGTPVGVYVNINTPPEILPGQIKYHDLLVDVVAKHGDEPKVVDLEELEKYYEEGVIPNELFRKAKEVVNEVLEKVFKVKDGDRSQQ